MLHKCVLSRLGELPINLKKIAIKIKRFNPDFQNLTDQESIAHFVTSIKEPDFVTGLFRKPEDFGAAESFLRFYSSLDPSSLPPPKPESFSKKE